MMKLKLMILDKNKKLGEDNSRASFKYIFERLQKEVDELRYEVIVENKAHMAEETLDVIQMCIAMLFKLFMSGINIEAVIQKHNKKLIDRYWKPRSIIKINVNRK